MTISTREFSGLSLTRTTTRHSVRGLLALATTAAAVAATFAIAGPAAADPAISPTPSPSPAEAVHAVRYWGPFHARHYKATAEGDIRFQRDPIDVLQRPDDNPRTSEIRTRVTNPDHRSGKRYKCAYVELKLRYFDGSRWRWYGGPTYTWCHDGTKEFAFYKKIYGLKVRVSQIDKRSGHLVNKGEWHTVDIKP